MRQVLVPIDPAHPARTRSAIDEVVRMSREEPVTVRLLSVQPKLDGHVAMFFDPHELHELQHDMGTEDLVDAQKLLDAAGVPYRCSVLVGHCAQTIVGAARDYGCDRIVFGRDEPSLAGRIFGSLAQQVRHLLGASADLQVIGS